MTVERQLNHLIVLTSPSEQAEISDLLEKAGIRLGDEVVEGSLGLRSRLMPIGGGGFIEIASELSPGSFPHGNPFARTPRLVSVCYTTQDAAGELERWRGLPGTEHAMAQAGGWVRQDGTWGYFLGVMPAPPVGDFFTGLQDRRIFPHPYLSEADTAPRVVRITWRGTEALEWRRKHEELLRLPADGEGLRAGDTELRFEETAEPGVEVTVTIAVADPSVRIPLLAGKFEFVPAAQD
ncbi:hypothetical protein [Amycolatopsis jejuensis]|uniref:hypothetical protein n=1 Tax=Amycolatopsis jejuensis TaxID=330084 RepID=UPI0005257C88|nr:hypothetical protein [Amycolatopsis jejuensis]